MSAPIPKDKVLEDVQRVASELGKPPSTDDYRERGEFTVRTVYNHFEGFVAAREEAGVSEGELRPNSREELLEDIRRVDEMVDGEPTLVEYEEHGEYSESGVRYRFGNWTAAKKEAGVYTGGHRSLPTEGEILEDIRGVDSQINGVLSQTKYDSKGKFYSTTARRVIGNWGGAC